MVSRSAIRDRLGLATPAPGIPCDICRATCSLLGRADEIDLQPALAPEVLGRQEPPAELMRYG
jgi:hypothetical protein